MGRRLAVLALGCASLAAPGTAAAAPDDAGRVQLVRRADPGFDRFTDFRAGGAISAFAPRLRRSYWRLAVSSPYFDDKTSWFPRSWAYVNAYGLYPGSRVARRHPDWLLRDAAGRALYIDYDCVNGRCARYAGDFTHPGFRRWWIGQARALLRRGYAGLWIDDVNLDFRVSNGSREFVRPRDRRTGRGMSEQAWRWGMADFMTEVRRALPRVELVHNSLWYVGGHRRDGTLRLDTNPAIVRAQRAADYLNKEGGILDGGLVGGTGDYSVDQLLDWVDRAHRRGKKVILDGFPGGEDRACFGDAEAQRRYALAAYLLLSTGGDALGDSTGGLRPYPLALGAARGGRFEIAPGVFARRFARGLVLLAEPGACGERARPVRVPLRGRLLGPAGRPVRSVALLPRRGVVLHTP